MRLLVSNPDTLGDLILRQPLYRALLDAGHELTLIVRGIVGPLVRHVAPGAKVLELPHEPYAHDLPQHWDRFTSLFDAVRSASPDALVIAPYRWTLFDERLAEELPGVKRIGLSGHLYRGDPHQGRPPASGLRFDLVAEVCEDAQEIEKNAALASAILADSRPLPFPRIDVPEPDRQRAAQILSELGLCPAEYWIACVTGTANVALKAWYRENWSHTLSRWAERRAQRFLFVGLASEAEDAQAVQQGMSEHARERTRLWMPPGGTIDELLGLTALSAGYVGHDTGPMHAAAALGKPVLAVFGGGHKLRFQPAVVPSVTVTMGVSCRGCQWICSFAESHCVKAVPVDEVLKAADDLQDGRVSRREARVLEPSHELQTRMISESARIAQERLRTASELARQLHDAQENWRDDVERVRRDADALAQEQREAVERAHAELGGQLREKEAAIRQQDEQLREKESLIREQDVQLQESTLMLQARDEQLQEKERALHEQHELLQHHDEALRRTSEEADRLREHATAASQQTAELSAALQARAEALARLQGQFESKSREASQLASVVDVQRDQIARLDVTLQEIEQTSRESRETAAKQSEEVGRLREQMQRLEERVRLMEPRFRPPRRPLKQVLVDFVIGAQHYYPPSPKPLPGITVVTVTHNSEEAIRESVESVIGQTHAHVQYVIVDRGSTDRTLEILEEYRGRIDKIVTEPAEHGVCGALATGYALATYDVLGRLDPGDVYEPGALTRVAEHFRDHPWRKAAVFEEAVAEGGWRLPLPPPTTPDVYRLLEKRGETTSAVFVTTNAYKALGGFNHERNEAAEWDLWLRVARRYGINVGAGHVRTTRAASAAFGHRADFQQAREMFESRFGLPGRLRCRAMHWMSRLDDALRRTVTPRLFYPLSRDPSRPMPVGTPPGKVPSDQPVCPLDGKMPDRLLFSARDTLGNDQAISYVYYDESADTALVYPPLDLGKLRAIYERDRDEKTDITAPDPARQSPYAGYRGRERLARILSRVRSPYWSFRQPEFGDPSVAELLATLGGRVPQRGVAVRFLNVGCYEGAALDALKDQTDWKLAGTETNPDAASVTRAKGHTVWETSAEDAALKIPVDQMFDVIYLAGLLEHLADPLLVLRRLRQILVPGGRIVIDTPNLDSKLLDVFGPTWSHWQVPYHRTLIGLRGLRKLARRGSFRIERLRTRTHPLPAIRSVQLNDLGLGAIVPDTAKFPPDVASRGVLLTGWARLLWDWRGRGDYLYAVLRAE